MWKPVVVSFFSSIHGFPVCLFFFCLTLNHMVNTLGWTLFLSFYFIPPAHLPAQERLCSCTATYHPGFLLHSSLYSSVCVPKDAVHLQGPAIIHSLTRLLPAPARDSAKNSLKLYTLNHLALTSTLPGPRVRNIKGQIRHFYKYNTLVSPGGG